MFVFVVLNFKWNLWGKRRFYLLVQNYAINLKNSATGEEKPSFILGRLFILIMISFSM